jgi:hypothetical protein
MNPSPAFGIYFPFWKLSIDKAQTEWRNLSDNCEILSDFALGYAVQWAGHYCPLADTKRPLFRLKNGPTNGLDILAAALLQYWHGYSLLACEVRPTDFVGFRKKRRKTL